MVIILDMHETFSIMYEVKVGVVVMEVNQHQRPITHHGQMETHHHQQSHEKRRKKK